MNSKVCTKCNIEKTIDEYSKAAKRKNGDIKYRSQCKACINQHERQLYKQNKKQVGIQQEQPNRKVCTKCNIEKTIDEYSIHSKKKNGGIVYRADCKACRKQYKKQRYQDNKEKLSVSVQQEQPNRKVCTKCNNEKTIDKYYKSGKKKNGDILYESQCKLCANQYAKQCREDNKKELNVSVQQEQPNSKVCSKCNIEKPIDEYSKKGKKKNGDIRYQSHCKLCINQHERQLYKQNKKQVGIQLQQEQLNSKVCTKCNIEKPIDEYYIRGINKNGGIDYRGECKTCNNQYIKRNKDKRNKQRKYRRLIDLEYKLISNIRTRISSAIHSQLNNGTKSARTHELLGISMDKYIRWIEFQLKDGWTWDNWGSDFHIDHVYPIAKHDLSKKEEQFKAFNWKNTRPMCKKENMAKGAKIIQSEVFQHKVTVLAFLFHEIKFFN